MTALAREEVFSPDEVACVHVMNRAVRQCYLMGDDPISGNNFDHRKLWMEEKLELHAANFGIDLLGDAILSNHFHLVLRSRPDVVATWDDTEVARRWWNLCPKRKYKCGRAKEPTEFELNSIRHDPDRLQEIRRRLSDISWWMRLLCQHVGQRANRETGETGKFWESRFKAVRLLDESALLACVAYVDLNPIRASLAETIESSDFTSAQKRLEALLLETAQAEASTDEVENDDSAERTSATDAVEPAGTSLVSPVRPSSPARLPRSASSLAGKPDRSLAPVHIDERQDELGACLSLSGARCSDKGFLNMTAAEYLELLDWTARQLAPGKRGVTPPEIPPLLERVGLKPTSWLGLVSHFGQLFHNVAGQPHEIARTRSLRRNIRFRVRAKVQEVFAA